MTLVKFDRWEGGFLPFFQQRPNL